MRNVAPDSVHQAQRAWAGRSLTAWRNETRGTLRLTLEVPIEEGELILRAIDCAVAAGEVTTDIDPAASESRSTAWRAQQADALVAVMRAYLDGGHGGEGGSTADRYQVVVHADAKSLRGGTGCADLPIEAVKRLMCDCSFVTVFEDENGQPLDVGRKQRVVSTPLRRALYARDRGCTFPGCQRKRYSRRASPQTLDQRRRDDSREPGAAVQLSPHAASRRRVQHRQRGRRDVALRNRRRPHDPETRLSAGGLRRWLRRR